MAFNKVNYQSALNDFNEARFKASLEEVLARLSGKSNELLSYNEVAQKLKLRARSDRGIREIPVNAIVGSVSRYTDYTRTFLPRRPEDQERWARVKAVMADPVGVGMPPIEVYKVGEVYFVLDGNHRVSIARQEGFEFIEAHVIEVQTDIPITPDLQPDEIIIKSEYAEFLEKTEIKSLRPNVDLSVTAPGQYRKLLDHIEVHRYFMGLDYQKEIPYTEAVEHWYDTIYIPFVELLRDRGMLRWFPERTETDLYLWVSEHRARLESELGWSIRTDAAMTDLAMEVNPHAENAESALGSWRTSKIFDRYTDRLFMDILVSISGSPDGWQALEQAILVAQNERAGLHGIHIVPPKADPHRPESLAVRERFNQRCQEVNLQGSLNIETGAVPEQVCKRALLNDLLVLNVSHPPELGLSSLNSGLRSIIWRSARPILTVPGKVSPMNKALLAFDGSRKSKEALFVAAYLAEQWGTDLAVVSLSNGDKISPSVQNHARAYLELHEIDAEYVMLKGSMDEVLELIKERNIDLILMGGYSGTAWKEVIIGSMVNFLLRNADCPILICR